MPCEPSGFASARRGAFALRSFQNLPHRTCRTLPQGPAAPILHSHMDSPSDPTTEIERHLKWRLLPSVVFIAILGALAVAGFVSLTMRPRHPHGIPDDLRARAAMATLAPHASVATDGLRLRAAMLGGDVPDHSPDAAAVQAAAAARPIISSLHRQHMSEPRALAALGARELVAHEHAKAAQHFRRACEAAPHYAEARLGAGVALAVQASLTPETWQSRALRLQAVAEFAMVDSTDEGYMAALYDRARVLHDAGRADEARFYAQRYLLREPQGPWAQRLQRDVLTP